MRIRWFGEPWPNSDARAAVCDEQTRVGTPVGRRCIHCEQKIMAGDQGLITAANVHVGAFTLIVDEHARSVVAWHLDCYRQMIFGEGSDGHR